MQCPACGTTNQAGMRFCTGCGQPLGAPAAGQLAPKCPACNQEVKPGAKFCTSCGQPLAGAQASWGAATAQPGAPQISSRPVAAELAPWTGSAPGAFSTSPPAVPSPAQSYGGIPTKPPSRRASGAFIAGLAVAVVLLGAGAYLGWKRFLRTTAAQPAPATQTAKRGASSSRPESLDKGAVSQLWWEVMKAELAKRGGNLNASVSGPVGHSRAEESQPAPMAAKPGTPVSPTVDSPTPVTSSAPVVSRSPDSAASPAPSRSPAQGAQRQPTVAAAPAPSSPTRAAPAAPPETLAQPAPAQQVAVAEPA
ncbi:MAG: zinc-ribbon domain-containing protein, partial [Bryobacteraceae bacterium]